MRQRLAQLTIGFSVLLSLSAGNESSLQAATVTLDGTIYRTTGGTTFDVWRINMVSAGSFIVDVLAYEASQSNTTAAGYVAADLNGDGELTWLDTDTYFYRDTGGPILAAALVRADDINNNTPVYYNGLTAATSPVTLVSLSQAEGALDGSIHFRRDPAFVVTMAPGQYLYLVADYRLDPTEAQGGINTNDNFSPSNRLRESHHHPCGLPPDLEKQRLPLSRQRQHHHHHPCPPARRSLAVREWAGGSLCLSAEASELAFEEETRWKKGEVFREPATVGARSPNHLTPAVNDRRPRARTLLTREASDFLLVRGGRG